MFRKVIVAVLAVTMMIFAAGLAYADDIDGLTDAGDIGGYYAYVNPGNLGDSLLYGYFNVRGMSNVFTIVNTSDTGVIARVRFREAKESEEVLDFNVCLSREDMFAAFVVDDGTQGRIIQLASDTTLTAPTIPLGGVPFKHAGNGGFSSVTADDTKEVYFEVFGLTLYDAEPTDCPVTTISQGPVNDVPNVLMGSNFMLEDATGLIYASKAMAVANFHNFGISTPLGLGFEFPVWASNRHGTISAINWAATKATVNSEYMLEIPSEAVSGEAAYVVNFFTKHETSAPPFGTASCSPDTDGVTISVNIFDENENTITDPEQFSPIITTALALCYEVNVIELGNDTETSDILNSGVEIALSTGLFDIGWIRIDLRDGAGVHSTSSCSGATCETDTGGVNTSYGLPAWVWWLQTVDDVLSHGNEMTYTTDIELGGF